jgi:uncharacterized protein YbaR (Trm112 family)
MGRTIIKKELANTRLANSYGGWVYCASCNETIGYLCYATYKNIHMKYSCKCGSKGELSIELDEHDTSSKLSIEQLVTIKNRLCCKEDASPLLTILTKKLDSYSYEIVCKECNLKYKGNDK